ncbi:MAG: glycerophosphodiester phosphodiesterase [Candidatus Limnocylindrales bacterium]
MPGAAGPLRLAHRGDHRRWPENSLAALVAGARAARSDGVEFDVRLTRDRVPVVIHDDTLERVQGAMGHVAAMTAAELVQHAVPALADVLAALPPAAFLDIELKVVPGPETAAVLVSARGVTPERAVVSAFDPDALAAIGRLAPAWPRWANVLWLDEAVISRARDLGCRGISAAWGAIDRHTAGLVADAGMDLAAWTVTRRPTYERLGRLQVAAACVEGSLLDR